MRSCTVAVLVDGEPFARDPAERHVGGADAVGAQHDLVERVAAPAPAPRCDRRRTAASAIAAVGRADRTGDAGQPGAEHRGLRPARAPGCRPRSAARPPTASTHELRGHGRAGSLGDARRAPRPAPRPCRPARRPRRSAGASGPRRTASSRDSSTRTAPAVPSASVLATPVHRGRDLAAEGAAVGERGRRLAAGLAPRRVGLEVGGLDPGRAQGRRPVAVGQRRAAARPRPWSAALHLAGRGAGLGQRLADRPSRRGRRARRPARRAARCRRRSRPAPSGHVRRDALRAAPLDRGPPARRRRGRARCDDGALPDRRPGVEDRAPAGAAAQVGSSACSTAASSSPPLARSPSSRTMIPGVQKPHWLAPVAQNASAQAARSSGASPSSVVMRRPATRRAGVTHATRGAPSTSTVQQPHWPCGLQPSFGERTPRWSRSASRSEPADSGTTTTSPSTSSSTGRDWACTDRG